MKGRETKAKRTWVCLALLAAGISAFAAEKPWLEVRSPNFVVVSNAGEKQARRAADAFEQIRAVFQKGLKVRVDPGKPFVILAVRDEKSLRELLPEFWEVKGRMRPVGVFQGGDEKLYVALRLDAQGENPYHAVYHEYVHMLVNLNFRGLRREKDLERALGLPLAENFDACVHLKGLPARVVFLVTQGADYAGEIISIEITKR